MTIATYAVSAKTLEDTPLAQGFESQVNAILAAHATSRVTGFSVRWGESYRVEITLDGGSTTGAPLAVKGFRAETLAKAQSLLADFVAANPTYWISPAILTTLDAKRDIDAATLFVTYSLDAASGANWGAILPHAASHLGGGADPINWSAINGKGLESARPAASAANNGYLYYSTDTQFLARSNGTSWETVAAGAVGEYWTLRTTSSSAAFQSVAWGNLTWVAVAVGGAVMTSPDGIRWATRTAAAANDWRSVVYGNGIFVAVSSTGTGNRVMTSPDGIVWTIRTSAADNTWYSVTFGGGLFVAVAQSGTGNRVMTSPDGIVWTIRTSAADNTWTSVCFGNGLFVAVASSGTSTRVMTSPDGIVWTTRTSAADNSWTGVCYGNGLFVAVAGSGTGTRVMTSSNGTTWVTRTSAADNVWSSVAYGNGLFVAVATTGTGTRVMTSQDAITWTTRTSAADNSWTSVEYANSMFLAVAGGGSTAMTAGRADVLNGAVDHGHDQLPRLTVTGPLTAAGAYADASVAVIVATTGGSTTLADTRQQTILAPAALIATYTVIMPASPVNGQCVVISAGSFGITTLTLGANVGQSFATGAAVTTLAASTSVGYIYLTSTATWYRRAR